MFSLISGFYRRCKVRPQLRVIIIGLDNAGKTTMLEQMKSLFNSRKKFPLKMIPPTIGLNIGRVSIGKLDILFWDMGGGEALREIWENYFDEAHAVFFVVDAADTERFSEARRELENLLSDSRLTGVPVMVAANKQDLEEACDPTEVATKLGISGIQSRALAVHGVSGLNLTGLREAVDWIANAVVHSDVADSGIRIVR